MGLVLGHPEDTKIQGCLSSLCKMAYPEIWRASYMDLVLPEFGLYISVIIYCVFFILVSLA